MKNTIQIGIIEFPGTNCERESAAAIRRAGMQPVHFRWNRDPDVLKELDGYLIAGGFSYEDRSRSGIIAALDPIIPLLRKEAEKGKPVIGICNGAQVLVETGMVPGLNGYLPGAALAANRRIKNGEVVGTGFYNAWVTIAMDNAPSNCAFTSRIKPGDMMRIPAAHAEGRFIIPQELLDRMIAEHMTVFRYSDESGCFSEEFPVNPNGSVHNIAGVCNKSGNVLALMPHPERTETGDAIFSSMHDYIVQRTPGTNQPDTGTTDLFGDFTPATGSGDHSVYTPGSKQAREVIVELIITDNEAVSVENALRHRGIPVSITRHLHWEIAFAGAPEKQEAALEAAKESGELFNSNKEFVLDPSDWVSSDTLSRSILIRDLEGEDSIGQHKAHALRKWFGIEDIDDICRGVIWTITPDTDDPEEARRLCDAAEASHIFANPYANRRYIYAG